MFPVPIFVNLIALESYSLTKWKNNKRISDSSIKTKSQSKIMMIVNKWFIFHNNPSKDLLVGPTTASDKKNISITEVPILIAL